MMMDVMQPFFRPSTRNRFCCSIAFWLCLLSGWVLQAAPDPKSASNHWAYTPPHPVNPPPSPNGNPIDGFLNVRHREEGLQPAPEVDPESWLRRVTYDLTGLPPTPAERADFLADGSTSARARVVDRLLGIGALR
jgi:hypothetical protein